MRSTLESQAHRVFLWGLPTWSRIRSCSLGLCSQNLNTCQQQLEKGKLLYQQQLADCRQQENLAENLTKQSDALRAQHEAFLEQVGSFCHLPCTAVLGGDSPSQDAQKKRQGDLSWSLLREGTSPRMA